MTQVNEEMVAMLEEMGRGIGFGSQFKTGAAIISTIPPDFYMQQIELTKGLVEDADEESKEILQNIIEVNQLAVNFSMKYRKLLRSEEQFIRKSKTAAMPSSDAAQPSRKAESPKAEPEKTPESKK